MKSKTLLSTATAVLAFGALVVGSESTARASAILTFSESGGNVNEVGSGTLNLTALTSTASGSNSPAVDAQDAIAVVGPDTTVDLWFTGFTGPSNFGSGGNFDADSNTGQSFGLNGSSDFLFLPAGYTSGASLAGTATFDGQTLASLGLTPGTYTWTWGSGATADSLTVQIGTAATPEPSSVFLVALPLAFMLRKRFRS